MNCPQYDPDSEFQKSVDQVLYGDTPIAIVAAADRRLASSLAELAGVQVLLFDQEAFGFETMSGQTVNLSSLASPPTCECVLVAVTPVSRSSLSELSMWWAETGGMPIPQLETIPDATIERIACRVLRVMLRNSLEATQRVSRSMVDLHRQIVVLREHNEEAGAIIESLRSAKAAPSSQLRISCEPADTFWCPNRDGDVACFSFPFRVFGLSQIDLHFCRCGDSVGWIVVTVSAIENDHVLGMWKIPCEQIDGWLPLKFARTLSTQSHYLRLQIEWRSQVGHPPRLSLSGQRVQLKGPAAIDVPMDAERIPAIRLYRGIPGQRQRADHWSELQIAEGAKPPNRPC